MKMRVVPGLLIAGLWLLLLVMGSAQLFCLVAVAIVIVAADEYFRMADQRELSLFERLLLDLFVAAPAVVTCFIPQTIALLAATLCASLLAITYFLYRYKDVADPFTFLCRMVFGIGYIGTLGSHLILMRYLPEGSAWLIVGTAITAGSDTGAYFVGKSIGKRKLCPNISPNKTVEGAIGGIAAGLLAGSCLAFFCLQHVNWPFVLLCGALLSGIGIIGDLTESIIKRGTGTKDSGKWLAGHGGILDRVDSLLFVGPFLYYLLVLSGVP